MLNGSNNENSKFATTKKWHVIDSESKGNYSHKNPIKFLTSSLESNIFDYSDAYILVTGNITVTRTIAAAAAGGNAQRKQPLDAFRQVIFKNCAPFEDYRTEITDTFTDYANFLNTAMPMYNLIEYSENYSDTPGSSWDFKRDEIVDNPDVTNDGNAPSFKNKASIIGNTEANGTKKDVKKAAPLRHLNNFWRSLEMLLINCKVELSIKWIENFVLTSAAIGANADPTGADSVTFKITDAKIYVPIVTLAAEDNAKLSKLLGDGLKEQFVGINIR